MSVDQPFVWKDDLEAPVECTEKVKVLCENHKEFIDLLSDVYEEGLALGVSRQSMKESLVKAVEKLGK